MSQFEKLYIIGNGFDVWHNLPTSYQCYNCFMCKNHPQTHDRIGHIFNRQNANLLWSNYENMLSQIDIVELVSRNIGNWVVMSEKNFKIAFDTLDNDIRSHFHEWVNQIDYSMATTDRLKLDTNAAFLNFNYTNTLERLYEVSPHNICYIHGDTGNNALYRPVIGHGDSSVGKIDQSKKDKIHKIVCDYGEHPNWTTDLEDFFEVILMETEIFLTGLKKDTKYYISEHQDWFNRMDDIKDIYIMGHSLSTIDAPYFTKIRNIAPDAKWHVSYYGEKDKVEKEKIFHSLFGESQKRINFKLFTLDELKVAK